MADLTFTVTDANVKDEMRKVWKMANKGLKAGDVIVTLGREGTSDVQGKCYHAMIRDISKQADLGGNKYDAETWKALLVSGFATEKHQMGEPLRKGNKWVPSLCSTHMVCIRPSVREFNKSNGSEFIEYLLAAGIEYGVKFDDRTLADYDHCREAN